MSSRLVGLIVLLIVVMVGLRLLYDVVRPVLPVLLVGVVLGVVLRSAVGGRTRS